MSWQLTLLNVGLRRIVRPKLARTSDPDAAAHDLARAATFFRKPPALQSIYRGDQQTWFVCGPTAARRVILWFHGGGYVAGSPETHAGMLGQLARLSGVEVCAPRYRLAQNAPFPAAYQDGIDAYNALIHKGYRPCDIVLGGDSAGGGLALAVLAQTLHAGQGPAATVVFSPWTDLAMTGDSLHQNAQLDPMFPVARIAELVDIYLQQADKTDVRASPLYADFTGAGPVLIEYGNTEILRDDSRRMVARLRACGVAVTERIHPTAPHVWQLFDGWLPEARASLIAAAAFVQAAAPNATR